MREDEIVSAVRDVARFDSVEHSRDAVRATLQVLGQRLAGGETKDLASNLPPSLAEVLPVEGPGERFGLDGFYERVAATEHRGCSPEQARQHARALIAALKVALPQGEYQDLTAQLPDGYEDLLGGGPVH